MNKKVVSFTIAMVLLLGITLGATFALMARETKTLTNTFVAGNFGTLDLYEHKIDAAGNLTAEVVPADDGQQYTGIVPGATLNKDPTIEYTADTEMDVWVYVRITGNDWVAGDGLSVEKKIDGKVAMSFELDSAVGWQKIDSTDGLLYYTQVADTETLNVIKDQQVKVDGVNVTLDNIANLNGNLIFTAYAVQKASDDAAADFASAGFTA